MNWDVPCGVSFRVNWSAIYFFVLFFFYFLSVCDGSLVGCAWYRAGLVDKDLVV